MQVLYVYFATVKDSKTKPGVDIWSSTQRYVGPWSKFSFGDVGKLPYEGKYLPTKPLRMCQSGWHFCTMNQLKYGNEFTNVVLRKDKYPKIVAFIIKTKGSVLKDREKAVATSLRFVKKLTVRQMRKLSKLKGQEANKALHKMAGLEEKTP